MHTKCTRIGSFGFTAATTGGAYSAPQTSSGFRVRGKGPEMCREQWEGGRGGEGRKWEGEDEG